MRRESMRERGSALLVSLTILTVVMVLGGLLLAIPQAGLVKEAGLEEKQAAFFAADAGIRDAIVRLSWTGSSKIAVPYTLPSPITFGGGRSGTATFTYTITQLPSPNLSQYYRVDSTGTHGTTSGNLNNNLTVVAKVEAILISNMPPPPFVPGAFSVEDKSGSSVNNTSGANFNFKLNGVTGVINGNDNPGADGQYYGGSPPGANPVAGVAFGTMPAPGGVYAFSGGGSSSSQILGSGGPPSIQTNASLTPPSGTPGTSIDGLYALVDQALNAGTAKVIYTSQGNPDGDTLGKTNHISSGANGSVANPQVIVVRPQAYPPSTANLLDITGDNYGIVILDLNWGYGGLRKDASGNALPDSAGPPPPSGTPQISPFNIGSPAYPAGGMNMSKDLFCMDGSSGSIHGLALIDSGSGSMNWSGQHLFELNGANNWSGAVNLRMNGPQSGAYSGKTGGSPVILANFNGKGKVIYSAEDLAMAMGALTSGSGFKIAAYRVLQ